MQVNIYVYIDSCYGRSSVKHYGYVLETIRKNGTPATVEGFGTVEATYHAATLTAIVEAMKRINKPCNVHVITENEFIANAAVHELPEWAGNEYRKKKGGDIANKELWQELWKMWITHEVLMIPGKSGYTEWLKRATKERN